MKLTVAEIQQVIREKIPEGLLVPQHDDLGHHYKHVPSGIVFDSVTTQMKGVVDNPNLKVWASRLAVEHLANTLTFNPDMLKDQAALAKLQEESIMQHRDTFEDAGGIGTIGHESVEKYTLDWMKTGNQPKDLEKFISGQDSREWAILRSAIEFFNDFYFIPVASELLICNLKDKYAGTLDCLGFIILLPENMRKCPNQQEFMGDKRHNFWSVSTGDWRKKVCFFCGIEATYQFALIDYKTSNTVQHKPTYAAQVSAYNKGFWAMTGLKTDLLIIVRLDKKQAKYEPIRVIDRVDCYRAFKNMRKVGNWLDSKADHAEPIFKKEIIKINENKTISGPNSATGISYQSAP